MSMSNSSVDGYSTATTTVNFPWPAELTGIERIALTAQGDLQRVLSAFFARPITIATVYSHTFVQASHNAPLTPLMLPNPAAITSASHCAPISQVRQVHLQCGGKIACTATSRVRITSPECARLFLEEKYAIGQMFRRLEKRPDFQLLSVGLGAVPETIDRESSRSSSLYTDGQLWRKYKLTIPDFECDILEVFPWREMFVDGEAWLSGQSLVSNSAIPTYIPKLTVV